MEKVKKGFALPTVLISSVVLLLILVTAVSATVAVRTGLQDQRYDRMAKLAGEAGTAYALACIEKNAGTVTWTTDKPLRPNTDCNGDEVDGAPAYVREESNLRTYFVVNPPFANSSLSGEGFVEVLRSSTDAVWRTWGTSVATAIGGSAVSTPVGTSIEGYWTSPPVGYLLEDGSAVSRTDYAALFAVIGTTFGAGDGSTTFNLPDSRGRVAVNLNTTDGEFNSIGEKSGAKTHTLTQAEIPSHTHSGSTNSAGSHSHSGTANTAGNHRHGNFTCISCGGSNGVNVESWSGYYSSRTVYTGYAGNHSHSLSINSAGTHSHSFDTSSVGNNQPHNNIQPSIVVTRAIKY